MWWVLDIQKLIRLVYFQVRETVSKVIISNLYAGMGSEVSVSRTEVSHFLQFETVTSTTSI